MNAEDDFSKMVDEALARIIQDLELDFGECGEQQYRMLAALYRSAVAGYRLGVGTYAAWAQSLEIALPFPEMNIVEVTPESVESAMDYRRAHEEHDPDRE